MTPHPKPEQSGKRARKPRIANPFGRSNVEWIGANNDARPPQAVRVRIFQRYDGRCYLTKQTIRHGDVWELEHIKPLHLARPGENLNRESNMAPALKATHALKSAKETTERAKCDRITTKHFGMRDKSKRGFRKHPTLKRTIDGRVVPRISKTEDAETTSDSSDFVR